MKRFTLAATLVAVSLSLAGLVRGADGVKAGQRLEVQYVVGAKTVFASAVLGADGTLSFAFPTEDGLHVGWAAYKLVRQDVQPGPDPKPPDPPVPIRRITDFYVVWETANATPAVAAIRNGSAWKDELTKAKIKWSAFDVDTIKDVAKFKAVAEAARKATLPAVVTVDESGGMKAESIPSQLLGEKAKSGPALDWILGAAKKAGGAK